MSANRSIDFKTAQRTMRDAGWRITRRSHDAIEWEHTDGQQLRWSHLAAARRQVPIRWLITATGTNPLGRNRPRPAFAPDTAEDASAAKRDGTMRHASND